ncbi:TPA: hypothetical protein ACGIK9_003394 [Acinetobacter baumannii]|uniref:hypothetical protein n=1 Tax=Acinetobacter baumannii TaxID=470 RepID=UPI00338FD067
MTTDNKPVKEHFILSYAFSLAVIDFPLQTVIVNVDSCLVDLMRTINLYSKVRMVKDKQPTETILTDFSYIFGNRLLEEVKWVEDIDLQITDFAPLDEVQLHDIRKVKDLLNIEFVSQDILLRRLKYDLMKAKDHVGIEAIKSTIESDLEFCFTPLEKEVMALIMNTVEHGKNLDIESIAALVNAHSEQTQSEQCH